MTVVWDLKTNKPIFKFTDPNLSFESGYYNESEQTSERPPQKIRLSWHPENATQLVVTCDDERFPFLNIWDLRQPNSPISSLSGGHDREIIDVAWNPLDPGLILSSGKDRLISSWHYKIVNIYIYIYIIYIGRINRFKKRRISNNPTELVSPTASPIFSIIRGRKRIDLLTP